MTDEKNLPKFKYHPNLYEFGILDRFHGTCECCGEGATCSAACIAAATGSSSRQVNDYVTEKS